MKLRILVALCLVFVTSCEGYEQQLQLSHLEEIHYYQDKRTDLCFAMISDSGYYVALATVPCDVVEDYLENLPAEVRR